MKKYIFEKGKYVPNIYIIILFTAILSFIAPIVGIGIVYGIAALVGFQFTPENEIFANLFSFIGPVIFVIIWTKYIEKRKISTLGLRKKGFRQLFTGVLLGIVTFSIIVAILAILGNVSLTKNFDFSNISMILLLLLGFIIQASSEELVARGWQFTAMGARFGLLPAILFSSIIFSAIHLANGGITVLAFINLLLYAFTMCLYVVKTKNLWGAMGFHIIWNFAQGNIFGFAVSGQDANYSLLKFKTNGADYLTGGIYGPEASIVATLAFIIILAYFIYTLYNDKSKR